MYCLCGVLSIYCNSPISIQNISEVVEYRYIGQFLKEHDVPFLGTDELQHETIQANISDNICRYKCLLQYTYTGLLIDKLPWPTYLYGPGPCHLLHTHLHAYNNVHTHTSTHRTHACAHTHMHTCTLIRIYISKCCCKRRVSNFPESKALNVEGCNLESLTWWHLLTQQHSELKEHEHSLQLHSSLATVYSSRQQ